MYKEYPKYVFKGHLMALVFSAEEREQLSAWTDTPVEGFVAPNVAHYHGITEIPDDEKTGSNAFDKAVVKRKASDARMARRK